MTIVEPDERGEIASSYWTCDLSASPAKAQCIALVKERWLSPPDTPFTLREGRSGPEDIFCHLDYELSIKECVDLCSSFLNENRETILALINHGARSTLHLRLDLNPRTEVAQESEIPVSLLSVLTHCRTGLSIMACLVSD